MKKLIILLVVVMSTGCASYNTGKIPEAVAVMPNDCANFRAIETYLMEITAVDKQPLELEESYEAKKSYYKRALWQLRYNCNPAS
ncbi:hypothetical protein N8Z09_04085 [Methylophilaceae bacterium]|nr:hypothetical protein [Methylophilaceae bacterium]